MGESIGGDKMGDAFCFLGPPPSTRVSMDTLCSTWRLRTPRRATLVPNLWPRPGMEGKQLSGGRPQGWASLTRLHRDSSAADVDPFPALHHGAGNSTFFQPSNSQQPQQHKPALPFASIVTKNMQQRPSRLPENTSLQKGIPGPHGVVARLKKEHGWADEMFIQDVLKSVHGDEDLASMHLYTMGQPESAKKAASEEKILSADDDANLDLHEAGLDGSVAPTECEDSDVYLKFRREALHKSRNRDKYARAAYNAFMAGDHAHAKQYSREAREHWKSAEKLHAQAAEEILLARNSEAETNLWSLDLHGLHATEAVMALQRRLAYLENELSKDPSLIYGHIQREPDQSRDLKGEESGSKGYFGENQHHMYLAAPRALVKKDLSVITGVGRHSKGGPSLPSAVKNFLFANGYKFTDTRPGVVGVTPKRHYV